METTLKIREEVKTLIVSSPAFEHRNYIPRTYSCEGQNMNPPLTIDKIPEKTKSLVLIVDDPDAPAGTWTHWLVWNIPPKKKIKENSIPGIQGITDFKTREYKGPCPPSGLHYYCFRVYALDTLLEQHSDLTRQAVEKAMSAHILAYGELIGMYKRSKTD
jgi:Raf kinase inhibitor-like YbhB/YbcL family protein